MMYMPGARCFSACDIFIPCLTLTPSTLNTSTVSSRMPVISEMLLVSPFPLTFAVRSVGTLSRLATDVAFKYPLCACIMRFEVMGTTLLMLKYPHVSFCMVVVFSIPTSPFTVIPRVTTSPSVSGNVWKGMYDVTLYSFPMIQING